MRKRNDTDEDILRVIDTVAGRTESGKETAAKEILALLTKGAEREAVLAYLESLRGQFIDISVHN